MELKEKIEAANRVIDAALSNFRRPAVMWSSGKDSMVLLFLLRARNINMPVIWHREPWNRAKYEFGERVAREWNLRVYDWAPAGVTLWQKNGHVCLVNHYQVGPLPKGTCAIPMDIYEPAQFTGGDWICGLRDVVNRPRGGFEYPWDVVLHGHKSSDVDPLLGAVGLEQDVAFVDGGPAVAFPLRHWTDEDIWDYTAQYDVPQQWDRYAPGTGTENPDRTTNPDYFAGCMRCIDRTQPKSVWCPKLKTTVNNISHTMPYTEQPIRPDYIQPELKEKPCTGQA